MLRLLGRGCVADVTRRLTESATTDSYRIPTTRLTNASLARRRRQPGPDAAIKALWRDTNPGAGTWHIDFYNGDLTPDCTIA